MDSSKTTQFFLGANSPYGFYSLYDDFVSAVDGDFLWIIKGGPGNGKSSFMRKIADAARLKGLDVEEIPCSGDPGSLDGIYIPKLRTAYVDGTSPHTMDADFPAASEMIVNLGNFYDAAALRERLPDIMDNSRRYKAFYARAYALLSAARAVSPPSLPGLYEDKALSVIERRANGAALREFGRTKGAGQVPAERSRRRFISALSCEGELLLTDTVTQLCPRVYLLDNDLGLAPRYLEHIALHADERKIPVIICPSPMEPSELEAVLIPSLSLAFVAQNSRRSFDGEVYRHVRLDALADMRDKRTVFRTAQRQYNALLDEALQNLAKAKALHDDLERIYNPHVDFEGVYALTDEHINTLGLR